MNSKKTSRMALRGDLKASDASCISQPSTNLQTLTTRSTTTGGFDLGILAKCMFLFNAVPKTVSLYCTYTGYQD